MEFSKCIVCFTDFLLSLQQISAQYVCVSTIDDSGMKTEMVLWDLSSSKHWGNSIALQLKPSGPIANLNLSCDSVLACDTITTHISTEIHVFTQIN